MTQGCLWVFETYNTPKFTKITAENPENINNASTSFSHLKTTLCRNLKRKLFHFVDGYENFGDFISSFQNCSRLGGKKFWNKYFFTD